MVVLIILYFQQKKLDCILPNQEHFVGVDPIPITTNQLSIRRSATLGTCWIGSLGSMLLQSGNPDLMSRFVSVDPYFFTACLGMADIFSLGLYIIYIYVYIWVNSIYPTRNSANSPWLDSFMQLCNCAMGFPQVILATP
jgi:hypothetical protein